MQPATIPAVLLAIALLVMCWAAPGPVAAASAADEPVRVVVATEAGSTWSERIAETAMQVGAVIDAGYQRAPALVLVLSALLLLPAAALVSFGVQAAARQGRLVPGRGRPEGASPTAVAIGRGERAQR